MSTQVALVTGGTKGTGAEIVKQFLDRGYHVVTNYRKDQDNAEKFQQSLASFKNQLHILQADMGEEEELHRLFDFIKETYGVLHVFIANAAATAFKPLLEVKKHHIEKTFAITVTGFILGCQRASQLMTDQQSSIIAISGYDTHTYLPRHGVLGSAKAALETLVKYFSVELAQKSIHVNAINPGFIDTTSAQIYMGDQYNQIKQANIQWTPAQKATKGKEIADIVMFLCSKEASWICGQTIHADGGLSHRQPLVLPEK